MPAYYSAVSNRRRAGFGDALDDAVLRYAVPAATPGLDFAHSGAVFTSSLASDAQHSSGGAPARVPGGPGSPGLLVGPPDLYVLPAVVPSAAPVIVGTRRPQ